MENGAAKLKDKLLDLVVVNDATEPGAGHALSFKCSDEGFAELVEREGIDPAPYMARAKWVALQTFDALSDREIQERISKSYDLVFVKLTKKAQADVQSRRVSKKPARR